jgi:hypothetical protein
MEDVPRMFINKQQYRAARCSLLVACCSLALLARWRCSLLAVRCSLLAGAAAAMIVVQKELQVLIPSYKKLV